MVLAAPELSEAAVDYTSWAFIVMFVFKTFDTGQPFLAFWAASSNLALSAPGIFDLHFKMHRGDSKTTFDFIQGYGRGCVDAVGGHACRPQLP